MVLFDAPPSHRRLSHEVAVVRLNTQLQAPDLRGHLHFPFASLFGFPPGKFWSVSHRAMHTFRLLCGLTAHVKVGESAAPTWVT